MSLLLYLQVALLSLAGWAVTEKLKIPAAGFLGPLLFVGATAIIGLPQPAFPTATILLLQVIFGAYLGCQADRDSVLRIRSVGMPVVITALWTVLTSFVLAFLLAHTSGVDVKTSFLATVPGGVAEMSALSIGMGADTAIVAAMQTLRVVATMAAFPILTQRALGTMVPLIGEPSTGAGLSPASPELVADPTAARRHTAAWLASLAAGLVGGGLFTLLRLPAGGLLGALAFVAVGRVAGLGLARPPAWLRIVALLGMGSYVGASFSSETLIQIRNIALPALLLTLAVMLSGMALARVVQRSTSLDYATALLACAPAGVTQMAIIADEIGSDPLMVTIFQLTRVMCCVFVMPMLVALFI